MYFSHSFIFSALSFLTIAIPMPQPPASNGIMIPLSKHSRLSGVIDLVSIVNGVERSVAKIERGMGAYQNNTGMVHPFSDGIETSPKCGTGSLPLSADVYDELWFGIVSIGKPAVEYKVLLDTGSGDLFVPHEDCRQTCVGHTKYNPLVSSRSVALDIPFNGEFLGGISVSGKAYSDDVTIANLIAEEQAFGAPTEYPPSLSAEKFPADGIMGMAFPSISKTKRDPVFQTLVSQKKVDSPVFCIRLSFSGNSVLFLGGINKDLFSGELTPLKLTKKSFWLAYFDKITVDGSPVFPEGETQPVIFDTGTNMILGPPKGVEEIFNLIDEAKPVSDGCYAIPCGIETEIVIYVGGKPVKLSSRSLDQGPLVEVPGKCLAGIASSKGLTKSKRWILGTPFFVNVVTVWNVEEGTISFADPA